MSQYQDRFPTGSKSPQVINVVVTALKGSKLLYKITPKGHMIPHKVTEEEFPFDYGVVPHAMGDTTEPLHAIVLSSEPSQIKAIAQVQPVGLIKVFTGEIQFYYIVATALYDPKYASKTMLKELPSSLKAKLKAWVTATERLKYKQIKVEWEDEVRARAAVEHSKRVYAKLAYL